MGSNLFKCFIKQYKLDILTDAVLFNDSCNVKITNFRIIMLYLLESAFRTVLEQQTACRRQFK